MTYDRFMEHVDSLLVSMCGMDSSELPDYHYRDDYEDDVSPKNAARGAIRRARDEDLT